jgi:hypothetical protein
MTRRHDDTIRSACGITHAFRVDDARHTRSSEIAQFPGVLTVSLDALASDPLVRVFRHQLISGRSAGGSCGKETCLRTYDHKDLTGLTPHGFDP